MKKKIKCIENIKEIHKSNLICSALTSSSILLCLWARLLETEKKKKSRVISASRRIHERFNRIRLYFIAVYHGTFRHSVLKIKYVEIIIHLQ